MKKYLFSLMLILSIAVNSYTDWREDIEIFFEENEELFLAVVGQVKKMPIALLKKAEGLPKVLETKSKRTTISFVAAIAAAVSGILAISNK